ncbi:MAG: PQQ-binding-like beta-propeller repeat protein [Bacteroidales bacterium]|nr:PQQ-binding-like beta-propeller repeat protein [Bacteroidales bacterium]
MKHLLQPLPSSFIPRPSSLVPRPSPLVLLPFTLLLLANTLFSQEVLQWRGDDRRGVYPDTELLQSWPESGPELIWEFAEAGNGYSSPLITDNRIYVTGEIDTITYLFALDKSGKQIYKVPVGKEWTINYPGSRSTPTLVDDLIYLTTGMGTVACLEAKDGNVRWSLNMMSDLHAPGITFGFAEGLLVDGNTVFCTPGNADTNVVALDRFTGEIQWISKGLGEHTAYCSPLLIRLPERNIMVTFTAHALLGIDTKDGTLLWSHKQDAEGDVHVNTPWFEDGYIYYITGDGNGSVKLKLSDDGTAITEIWRNKACDNTMGGFIKLGNYIYTASYEKRKWYVQDATTGANVDSVKFDKGAIIFADNMLYLYNERGQLGLFKPDGPKMVLVSSFKITRGSKAHYAHPVISDGILYVRHGNSLMAYNVKK